MGSRHENAAQDVLTFAGFADLTRGLVDERSVVSVLVELFRSGQLEGLGESHGSLTQAEADFLMQYGGTSENRRALLAERMTTLTDEARLDAHCLTIDEAAARLGVSASRVRHRIAEGSIYAFPGPGRGRARRLPDWQFTATGQATPHLGTVLGELPDDFLPLDVEDFALNAQIERRHREDSVPLLEWLRSEGDPAPAIALAAAQGETL